MKKIISKIKWSILALALPMAAGAATITTVETTGASDLMSTVKSVLNTVVGLAGLIAVIFMVVGGILIITSGGDEDKSKKGKGYVTYGVIGLIIVIIAGALVNYLIATVK